MTDKEFPEIGKRLKMCRKDSGLNQARFAEALGVSSRSYQHYENATREAPVSVLTTAARVSGRDFHWLITGKLEGQVDLYEQAVLAAFECLEREGLPQPPKAVVAIARRALELALEKNTKPADEVPKLVTLHDSAPCFGSRGNPEPWRDGIERVCSETVSDVIEADPEPRFGIVSVRLPRWVSASQAVCSRAPGPGDGQGNKGHQEAELTRLSQARVLKVEAAGLGVAEQAFDSPPFAVGFESSARGNIRRNDEPFVTKPLCDEIEERCIACRSVLAGADPGAEGPAALGAAKARAQGQVVPVLGGDTQALLQANGKGDIVILEELQPCGAGELTIGKQHANGRGRKVVEIALDQGNARVCVGTATSFDQVPDQGHPETAGDNGEHQIVHLGPPDLPLGSVERQMP